MRFLVINGPGASEGGSSADELDEKIMSWGARLGVDVEMRRPADADDIIASIVTFEGDGMIINPGDVTDESRVLNDAMVQAGTPIVEVHIAAVTANEPHTEPSISATVGLVHIIQGRGISGYRDALRHLVNRAALPFESVTYGAQRDQVGDLRGAGSELIVFVHGGLWLNKYARDTIEGLAVDAARRGFKTWNLEFRRLGGGGGWPVSGEDVLKALDFVPDLADRTNRMIVVSHSAGSQLAMWAAERSTTEVDLHVAMGPLLDLDAAVTNGDVGAAECERMLAGGAPPINRPGRIETVIVHGQRDQIVPVERSEAIVGNSGVELFRPDTDHFALLDHESETWNWIIERIGI